METNQNIVLEYARKNDTGDTDTEAKTLCKERTLENGSLEHILKET
jgi:hypothetical protein